MSDPLAEFQYPPSEARVFVCLGMKEWVGALPSRAWAGEFLVSEAEVANLRREVEEIVRGSEVPYTVSERRGRTSWGADSGEVVRVALFVGTTGVEALIGAAMVKFLQVMAKRAAAFRTFDEGERPPLSQTEAEHRAKWAIVSHYTVVAEGLEPLPAGEDELTAVGHTFHRGTGSWTITLRDTSGATYKVKMGHLDGLATVDEIGRWSPGIDPE